MILLAVIALGLLIIVHELGHMLVARAAGMRVERFSVGFGPALARWRGRRTTYQIAVIPLGGFVQIAGMNPHEKLPPDDDGSYANKPPIARFLAILAGPLTNYVFAVVLMLVVMFAWGEPRPQLRIDATAPGLPAEAAGLRSGDVLVSVAGYPVFDAGSVVEAISQSQGREVAVRVERQGKTVLLQVTPRRVKGGYKIGVTFGSKFVFERVSTRSVLLESLYFPVEKTWEVLVGLGQFFKRIFRGQASMEQVGGPVEIVHQISQRFHEGFGISLLLLALLNVYLGLFNLLPIPALDGGRLVFLGFTMLTRQPVNQRAENLVHTIGFLVLLGLILLVTYRDVLRLLGH